MDVFTMSGPPFVLRSLDGRFLHIGECLNVQTGEVELIAGWVDRLHDATVLNWIYNRWMIDKYPCTYPVMLSGLLG